MTWFLREPFTRKCDIAIDKGGKQTNKKRWSIEKNYQVLKNYCLHFQDIWFKIKESLFPLILKQGQGLATLHMGKQQIFNLFIQKTEFLTTMCQAQY